MSIKDQADAAAKRRAAKAHVSATIDATARNRQAQLNKQLKDEAEARTKNSLAEHRPDITLVRYYNAENVTLECNGVQKTYEARYIRRNIHALFGGAKNET